MVIATLTALFLLFGGSKLPFSQSLDVTAKQVKAFVQDPERRDRALAVLKQMENLGKEDASAGKEFEKALDPVAARRAATADDFRTPYEDFDKKQRATVNESFALRFQLKDALTRAEWAKVFPPAAPSAASATANP